MLWFVYEDVWTLPVIHNVQKYIDYAIEGWFPLL